MDGGDHFEAFVRQFQDMVYAVALRLLGEPADAEDVAQNVFLLAYRDFDTLSTNPAAPGWLKTTTTNLSLNHLTRHRARWQLFSEIEGEEGRAEGGIPARISDGLVGEGESWGGEEEWRGQYEMLERELQALPDHQRVPLVLYHFEEKSYQDIAGFLGVSLGKVKTDIHRGREALKRKMVRLESDRSVRGG
jgi:RNA polymerase sigma-70 factor (ECF subfamily)